MPPKFFFQLLQVVFILHASHRTQLTDPVIDLDQFLGWADKRVVSFHLLLHLFQFRPQRQVPRLGLAADTDVPQILGSVPRMVLTSTCAVAPTALAVVHGNGATAEIAQVLHLAEQVFSTRLQLLQRLIHSASNLNDYTHSDYRPKKERAQLLPTNLTRT